MNRSPRKLHQAARTCREMASECVTEEARNALLAVAQDLEVEASDKEQLAERRAPHTHLFSWTR